MSMALIDAPAVRADRPFAIQGYGRTYELTEAEFNAAIRAVDSLSPQDSVITTGQAAEILGVSAKTVTRILDAGKIPFHRNGGTGHRMMERRDVLSYKAQRGDRRHLLDQARDLAHAMGSYDASVENAAALD